MDERSWLQLRHCRQIPASRILERLRQMPDTYDASVDIVDDLRSHGTLPGWALTDLNERAINKDADWLDESPDRHLVSFLDPRYPQLLRELMDPPLLLYAEGKPELLASTQLAIVGSRNPTPNGRETASRLAARLASLGLTITSGLADGIDTAAHQGTLSVAGSTIAVLANGLDDVYPVSNKSLARRIRSNGLLVSEQPVGTPPSKRAFPRRNRIISGLSRGTLVVEAAARSGSLITARLAGEQGREVFAVPGSVLSPQSKGCHGLIRNGATLVETEADIFFELGPFRPIVVTTPPPAPARYPSCPLVDAMGYDPVTIDTLVQRSGLTAETVSSMLLSLELQGVVKPMPGGHYIRTV